METVLLKVPEVMERLGCGHTKLYELISSGELASVMFGGCRRVPSDELERFLAGLARSRWAPCPFVAVPAVAVSARRRGGSRRVAEVLCGAGVSQVTRRE